jgi:hypothetical protein
MSKNTIYLFKEGQNCTDVFNHVYQEMKSTHECVKIIDDEHNFMEKIDSLKGERIVLITTDHFHARRGNKKYTIDEIVDILSPVKKYYSFHDLGVHTRSENNLSEWNIILPTMEWNYFFDDLNIRKIPLGYPKYLNNQVNVEYESIFFPSLIYVYKDRDFSSFYNDFKFVFDNGIPIKFPDYSGSYELIEKLKNAGIEMNLLETKLSSFDLLFKCNNSITNSNSSIAIEAVIAGANSINIGNGYKPYEFYNRFPIINVHGEDNNSEIFKHLKNYRNLSPLEEYKFDINGCINEIINEK